MTNPLTPEQIELLRSLPIDHYPAPLVELVQQRLAVVELSPNGGSMTIHRTPAADTLLATIDSERGRLVKAIADDLEDAATDCDGHTPYSILMALAEEVRRDHLVNGTKA